ncbi:MAG: DUF92 domain-containing protein [Gemmatimonadota bacterium]|nr:DUF92 domain-containing protein [Gemmatimonadota bacterium]
MIRLATGTVLAAAIAILAVRLRLLTRSGAIASTVIGALCMAAGWSWGILLIAFFALTSALERMGGSDKRRRTDGMVAKSGARDAIQVLANGGPFAAAATLWLFHPYVGWQAAGAGALATAMADSWGTELGTLVRTAPRLITTGGRVPPGTSGGVTALGFAGTALGAVTMALVSIACGWGSGVAVAATIGGVTGAVADSLVGALWQARRHCESCDSPTEQRVHFCGLASVRVGGIAWLDNDAVNLSCGLAGALTALLLSR